MNVEGKADLQIKRQKLYWQPRQRLTRQQPRSLHWDWDGQVPVGCLKRERIPIGNVIPTFDRSEQLAAPENVPAATGSERLGDSVNPFSKPKLFRMHDAVLDDTAELFPIVPQQEPVLRVREACPFTVCVPRQPGNVVGGNWITTAESRFVNNPTSDGEKAARLVVTPQAVRSLRSTGRPWSICRLTWRHSLSQFSALLRPYVFPGAFHALAVEKRIKSGKLHGSSRRGG